MRSLERKYGKFQGRKGEGYTFYEEEGGGVTWECTFRPPYQRLMQTYDSTWANRTDYFQEAPGGTLWTIVWEPKGRAWSGVIVWEPMLPNGWPSNSATNDRCVTKSSSPCCSTFRARLQRQRAPFTRP